LPVLRALQAHGVDMVEIGIPFSDPVADGPAIQKSNSTALRNGMTQHKLFEQLTNVRAEIKMPLILMGYLNPLMQYGWERFCADAARCDIDGLIVPDLPLREYQTHYRATTQAARLDVIQLITPQTSEERIRQIDEASDGFLYMVSSAATTGAQKGFSSEQLDYFRRVNNMKLKNPRMIGFGISNADTLKSAHAHAAGAIIGSHFISLLTEYRDPEKAVAKLMETIGVSV